MAMMKRAFVTYEHDPLDMSGITEGAVSFGQLVDTSIGQALVDGKTLQSISFEFEPDDWLKLENVHRSSKFHHGKVR